MMVVLRSLQGLAAAFMAPTALSILLTTFKEGPERHKALSIWSIVASGGAAAGVFLGGLLTQYLSWEWCFFVNVPIGLIALWGIRKYVPEHNQNSGKTHLDISGAILITGGLTALVYALTLATQMGWGAFATIVSFGISIVLLSAFIFNETKVKQPLVSLGIFRIRNVVGGNLIMLPIVAGALGQFFFLSLYVQNILQYSPVQSGLSFLPIPLIIGAISYNAPKFMSKFGFKPLMVTGISLVTLGVFLVSLLGSTASYWLHMFPAFLILATGFGLSFLSITVAATSGVEHNQAGLASGLINTSQQVGGALGLAILAVVAHNATVQATAAGKSVMDANVIGYQQAFLTASVLIFIALLIAIFVIRTPKEK